MAWGKSKPAPASSTIGQILPLVILLTVLAGVAYVGYQIYLSVAQIQEKASERMGKKNVVFTKDGVRVGVKHVENEDYVDKTQSYLVKAWNLGEKETQKPHERKKLHKNK